MVQKKKGAFRERLGNVLRSGIVRNTIIFGFLLLSVFCMFLLDRGNYVRARYMPGLSSNFVSNLLDVLHIGRYNIGIEAWVLFFIILFVVSLFLIANMFSVDYVYEKVEAKKHKFNTENGARRFYTAMYYLTVFVIAALLVFIFVMAGGLERFRPEAEVGPVFIDLVYTLLLCLLFIAIGIVFMTFMAIVLRMAFGFIYLLATGFAKAVRIEEEGTIIDGTGAGNGGGINGGSFTAKIDNSDELDRDLFPALTMIDLANAKEEVVEGEEGAETVEAVEGEAVEGVEAVEGEGAEAVEETAVATVAQADEEEEITLEEFALRFQSYACNHHKVYYELPLLRSFIAGMASSRLIILEGLSGTGKSLLPRMFSRFTGSDVYFSPVQATWRDKTDVLGFYSEFTKTFKITDFLRDLYSSSYSEKTALMVLDEMNLSRIEYYFADFLSILEYPKEEWKIKVFEPELEQRLPVHLEGGYVKIPANTWFIGTANTDDSTFTITDKVYDRAITLDFRERISPISSNYISDPLEHMTSEKLQALFDAAKENPNYCLTGFDTDKFFRICDFIKDAFDIRFGNRIMVQITNFVPVYVALGGTKEAALDFMLASKVLRKLEGMFEDYVKDELIALTKLLNSTYGKGTMVETERIIAKILKRLV
ncbi:MAG: hypothetical protein E7368_01235 [Clostridiales bacterium]|nr:hypothetical protein [Clostridiales bacterium]